MQFIKFIRVFLLSLIIIGIGLLVTQKMWVPKLVDKILESEGEMQQLATTPITQKTYRDEKNGFEFKYPADTKIIGPSDSTDLSIEGTKYISVYIQNLDTDNDCDTQCYNIETNGKMIPVHYGMTGDYHSTFSLSNGKFVVLHLSCDSRGDGGGIHEVYCIVSDQRVNEFIGTLKSFKVTK